MRLGPETLQSTCEELGEKGRRVENKRGRRGKEEGRKCVCVCAFVHAFTEALLVIDPI